LAKYINKIIAIAQTHITKGIAEIPDFGDYAGIVVLHIIFSKKPVFRY